MPVQKHRRKPFYSTTSLFNEEEYNRIRLSYCLCPNIIAQQEIEFKKYQGPLPKFVTYIPPKTSKRGGRKCFRINQNQENKKMSCTKRLIFLLQEHRAVGCLLSRLIALLDYHPIRRSTQFKFYPGFNMYLT
jgi:hypothetical protein